MRLLLALAVLLVSSAAPARGAGPNSDSGGPAMELYFEAMDGQSWQWLFMADAARRRLPGATLEVLPLVAKGESGWISKRGEPELEESARIAYIASSSPSVLSNYLNARSLSPWADGWRDAALFSGLDPDELGKSASGGREELLAGLYKRAAARKVEGTALYINGKPYEGEARLLALYGALNAAMPESGRLYKPQAGPEGPAAASAPAPKLWVIAAPQEGIKAESNVTDAFKRYFASIKPRELDYSSSAAKKLLKSPRSLPAYVIEDTPAVRKHFAQAISAGAFEVSGKTFVYYDKGRKSLLPSSKKLPGELELFTMSQCPFGVQAGNSIIEAQRQGLLPKGTRVRLRYIAEVLDDGGNITFKSLHGSPEWEENARQLFISKTYPDKFFDYLTERNKDVMSGRWEPAAEAAGIDPAKVTAGFEEGKKLLAEDVKRAGALGIGTSPTFLVEGRLLVTGLGELSKVKGFEKVPLKPNSGQACSK